MKRKISVPKEIVEAFGFRVKAIREKLRLKQKEFAAKLELSESYICQIEKGKANPTFEFFYRMITRVNVNMNYLFYGEGEMFCRGKPGDKNESEIPESIESTEDFQWFMEHSSYFRMSMELYGKRVLVDSEEYIIKDIEKVGKKKKGSVR